MNAKKEPTLAETADAPKEPTLAETAEALRLYFIDAEARQDLAWIGSLEKLRRRTEEQKALRLRPRHRRRREARK